MESLGAKLKAAREQKQLTLSKVANDTRIGSTHLGNLEAGNYGALPGGVYNRAFLRAYCEYLGLDAQEMLDRYQVENLPPVEKQQRARPAVKPTSSQFTLQPVAIWSLMLVATIVGIYSSRRWIAEVFSPYFARAPVATHAPPKAEPPPAEQRQETPPAATGEQITSPGSDAAGAAPAVLPPQVPGTIRLQLEVTQRCWVSVTSDGSRVLVKLLEPGDTQTFDAVEGFYVIFGNAGGVRAAVNGRRTKPFGKDGEVVKVVINQQTLSDLLEQPNG